MALALAANVDANVPELNALDYVPDAIPDPCFMVAEMDIEYHQTMARRHGGSGMGQAMITCRVMTSRGDDENGQQQMRSFSRGAGVTSVIQAIESDRTLGGACHDLKVASVRGNRMFTVGEKQYYGSEFGVMVIGDDD